MMLDSVHIDIVVVVDLDVQAVISARSPGYDKQPCIELTHDLLHHLLNPR